MSYLSELLDATRRRVDEARSKVTESVLEERTAAVEPARGFKAALVRAPRPAVIAEIKRRSPSKGPLNEDLDAGALAERYAAGGAAAISVLTEPDHFGGSLEDLRAAGRAGLPLLRKDFIVDQFQVLESRAEGADAILLIVRALGPEFETFLAGAKALGMDALVEVYDEDDVERALAAGADLVGINHRDLETFEVDPMRTAKLAPLIGNAALVVALSGVTTREDVDALASDGAEAILVGEALVTAPDPSARLRALTGR